MLETWPLHVCGSSISRNFDSTNSWSLNLIPLSKKYECNLRSTYYFKDSWLDEWEVCLCVITPSYWPTYLKKMLHILQCIWQTPHSQNNQPMKIVHSMKLYAPFLRLALFIYKLMVVKPQKKNLVLINSHKSRKLEWVFQRLQWMLFIGC